MTKKSKKSNKSKNKESFGIVPIVKIDQRYLILFQTSFSSFELDFKMDPLRGHRKIYTSNTTINTTNGNSSDHHQQPDIRSDSSVRVVYELEVDAAVRETSEESKRVLDFSSVSELLTSDNKYCGLYYIRIAFSPNMENQLQDLRNVLDAYDHNSTIDKNDETCGLVFYHKDYNYGNIRMASEAKVVLESIETRFNIDQLPIVLLNRTIGDDNLITYKAMKMNDTKYGNQESIQSNEIKDITQLVSKGAIIQTDEEMKKLQKEYIIRVKLEQYGDCNEVSSKIKDRQYLHYLKNDKDISEAIRIARDKKNSNYFNKNSSNNSQNTKKADHVNNNTTIEKADHVNKNSTNTTSAAAIARRNKVESKASNTREIEKRNFYFKSEKVSSESSERKSFFEGNSSNDSNWRNTSSNTTTNGTQSNTSSNGSNGTGSGCSNNTTISKSNAKKKNRKGNGSKKEKK